MERALNLSGLNKERQGSIKWQNTFIDLSDLCLFVQTNMDEYLKKEQVLHTNLGKTACQIATSTLIPTQQSTIAYSN